ncbi:MAG: helix-turn-helix transcriptional regulator [Rhodospirillaceae bacterium]|nr:helix-turn-helix transcriptional regulator [Rhodospirillaceae bacterium]MBT3492165.1 helix-turn-helix transcriptional regulator [Rhodospirillaceae bacterium]MBT3779183.1 helix-turn-helix transcriptional regulator [Rhodospirillaceae bacterium]MBT3975202.1 helix-turn-helix transcriptional regulator [Rhodospirillaceae bacterium]MBT4168737.1 helix-turn-helix transcriptional regulator [Rhodospirillaceae bacterium]
MIFPKPGGPVRGSKTGRPVMALLDLLGRRMCLRILWELQEATLRFRPLQEAAETNPNVLNTRLGELREAGLVALAPDGYQLTSAGRDLAALLLPLNRWADDWADDWAEGWAETLPPPPS